MRMTEIEVSGKSYPLCFSLRAVTEFCAQYGDLDSCFSRVKELSGKKDTPGLIEEYLWQLTQLLDAGARSKKKETGEDISPPDLETLRDVFSIGDLSYIQKKVIEAINAGNQREVSAQAPKNGDGATA